MGIGSQRRDQAVDNAGPLRPGGPSRVTVVVVTYNSGRVVPGLLARLPDAMAGISGWELIVADNASDDDTLDVVRALAPAARIVEMGRNAGYSAGLNAAVAVADDTDAVLLLNPDIRPRPGFAATLLSNLDGDVGIVAPRLLEQDGQQSHSLRRDPSVLRALGEALLGGARAGRYAHLGEVVRNDERYETAGTVDWASGAALLIDRRCLDDVGGWDESFFLYSEETEFALRARDAGWKTRFDPSAVAVHIGGESSVSPRLWALLTRNRVRLFRRRHRPTRAAAFWLATVLNEALRAATGSPTHTAGLRALLGDPPAVPHPRRNRVLIVVQNLPVPADRRVWREAQALVAAGFQVSVISPKADGDPSYERLDGVDLYRYAPPPPTHGVAAYLYEFIYCWLATARLTLRVLRRTGIDVLQACNPPDTYFALAAPLKFLGVKFVFDHHDLCPEVYRVRFGRDDGLLLRGLYVLERATFTLADHVISTNQSYMDVAMRRGDLTAGGVTIVRNGPDPDRMRRGQQNPQLRNGRKYLCVYLGVMGPQDGVDLALHAAHQLIHQLGYDVQIALLGDGDCYRELRALADELDIADRTTFTGWADDDMICDYLSTADIGLCPDPKTPFNDASTMNKTLEYMAYELPMVSFDLRETRVSAGPASVYVTESSSTAYANAIAALLDDRGRRHLMGVIGRQRVEETHAWQHQVDAYVATYEALLGGP